MVFGRGRKKEGVGLFPSLVLCAWVCTAQLCKGGLQKEGDQLSAMSGFPVEIHSWFSSLHLDKKKENNVLG